MTENIGIILGAGEGNRYDIKSKKIPKQFCLLGGKRIIEYSMKVFEKHADISKVIVVTSLEYFSIIQKIIREKNYTKPIDIIEGGKERYESTYKAIKYLQNNYKNQFIIIHDAARPFIQMQDITNCIAKMQTYSAVSLAIDVTDTIFLTHKEIIHNIPDRKKLKQAQTPQCFHFEVLQQAYEKFMKIGKKIATDDCSIISQTLPDKKISWIPGSIQNIKITYPNDIKIAKTILKEKRLCNRLSRKSKNPII